ncbi:MAG: hypothetical protein PHE16_09860 [Aliarcobacter sp.]|nr:hypothetical protein [Aliarcobacter sp.]
MFFESFLPMDYEIISKKHIIEKNRIIGENKLNLILPIIEINENKVHHNKIENKIKKNSFQQFNFKYDNSFFVSLNKQQKEKISNITSDENLKHLVLLTYSNDNEVAIKRLEYVYNMLPPKLRTNTIYKQEQCYEGNPCNTTNIKLIY